MSEKETAAENMTLQESKKKNKKEKVKKSLGREILEWVLTIVIALIAALIIHRGVFELVRVEGESMLDTLNDKEIMLVSKYDFSSVWLNLPLNLQSDNAEEQAPRFTIGTPKMLDVVICRYPGRGDTNFVKRIVGLPGDTVELENGYLKVNGQPVEEERTIEGIAEEYRTNGNGRTFGSYYVPGKGDTLTVSDRFEFTVNGESWNRKQTRLIAKDADGKTLKIYNRKVNDQSKTGMTESTEIRVAYDGKDMSPAEFLEAYPGLIGSELTIDEDYYFVMGDHRNNSNDSRSVGALERSAIMGHVRRVVYPFSSWRGIE